MFSLSKRDERYSEYNFLKTIIAIVVFMLAPFLTHAATLSISPASGSYSVGQTFAVSFYTSNSNQSINAVSGTFNYSENLEIVSVSKNGSIFSLWVQEPGYSNVSRIGSFEGIVLNPGFMGNSGKLVTYTFRVKSPGIGAIRMGSASVLANDGNGTNVFSGSNPASFNLIAAQEKPVLPQEVMQTGASTVPEVKPVEIVASTGILEIKEIPREDSTNPLVQFKISVKNSKETLKKYEIRVDQSVPFVWEDVSGKGIFTLPKTLPGRHTLLVKTLEHDTEITGYADFSIDALSTPTIVSYTKNNHLTQQSVVIYGTSMTGYRVAVVFEQKDGQMYTEDIAVDDQGRFLFIVDKKLAPGTYTMQLFAHNNQGASSEYTNPAIVKIKRHPFLDFGLFTLSLPVFALICALLVISATITAIVYRWLYAGVKNKPRRKKIATMITDSLP